MGGTCRACGKPCHRIGGCILDHGGKTCGCQTGELDDHYPIDPRDAEIARLRENLSRAEAERDDLMARANAAENRLAALAPKDPPPGAVVSDLARRFNRAMGRQEWSADGVRAAAVVERALAAGPAALRALEHDGPWYRVEILEIVEAAQERALKGGG